MADLELGASGRTERSIHPRKIQWASLKAAKLARFSGIVFGASSAEEYALDHVNRDLGDTIDIHGGGADLEFLTIPMECSVGGQNWSDFCQLLDAQWLCQYRRR